MDEKQGAKRPSKRVVRKPAVVEKKLVWKFNPDSGAVELVEVPE